GVPDSIRRKSENEGCKIGVFNFRCPGRYQVFVGTLTPKTVTHSGTETARTTGALIGGILGYCDRSKTGKPCPRIKSRHSGKTAVYHDGYAFNGERRLCDGRREHDLTSTPRFGFNSTLLGFERQVAVQRQYHQLRIFAFEYFKGAANFGRARQEHEDVALLLPYCLPACSGNAD